MRLTDSSAERQLRAMIDQARALLQRPDVSAACAHIEQTDGATLARQIELAQTPAPGFQEGPRGDLFAEMLADAGARDIERDAVGNVLASLGSGGEPPLILSAHLDTVFPADTDLTVVRRDGRLVGPGISDDARGLAALVAVVDAIRAANLKPARPLLVVGTVGEEGAGDLRGGWHLFRSDGPGQGAVGFVSLDGAGLGRIVHRGLGARRLRVTVHGPGGHSWLNRDRANPIHALGTAVEALARLPRPTTPESSCAVTRWGGGRSINAIPDQAWIEIDVRSESPEVLVDAEERVRKALELGVLRINEMASDSDPVRLHIDVIGSRPAGQTALDSPLVEAAIAATRALGQEPRMIASSTDANVPMHLGIDALTLGAGGRAGGAHTLDEWYMNSGGTDGVIRALVTALLVTGLAED